MTTLLEEFQPIFDRIAVGALDRELNRELPHEQVGGSPKPGSQNYRLPKRMAAKEFRYSNSWNYSSRWPKQIPTWYKSCTPTSVSLRYIFSTRNPSATGGSPRSAMAK